MFLGVDMTFNIKDWRIKLGITQEKAAELLGVHRISYINWETGKVPISKSVELACYNLSPPQQPYSQLFKNIDEYKDAYRVYYGSDPVGKHLIYTPWKTVKYKLVNLTPDNLKHEETHQSSSDH